MATNLDVQPWAPDPDAAPGTPPRAGGTGERGSSSFPGTALYNADNTLVDPNVPERGPKIGKLYYPNAVPTFTHSTNVGRSSAHGGANAGVFTVATTASNNAPVRATAVTLTATVSDTTATGPVDFYDGSTKLGSGTAANGVATYAVTAGFTVGAHQVKSLFDGVYSPAVTVTAS